jgi:uroporphyrinogen-III decarboxylase
MKLGDLHASLNIKRTLEPVSREEYLDHMTFRANRRPLFTELFGPLVGLKEEWASQGARPEELDFSGFHYRDARVGGVAAHLGWMGGEERILEDTPDHTLGIDQMGRRVLLVKQSASLPHALEYPVKNREDWLRVKQHYEFSEDRLPAGWEEQAREHLRAGRLLGVGAPGAFFELRELMGEEVLCLAFYEQPDLVHEMLDTIAQTALAVLDRVTAKVPIDQLAMTEDLAGKSGPLIGPRQMREFVQPYYRAIWGLLSSRGARVFDVDSDGQIGPVIDDFLDAGVNVLHPMEPGAGMDIVKVRAQYGRRLGLRGGIDKYVLRRSQAEILAELEYKIPPMVASGACVLGLDHRIPAGTPLANYRFYIQKAWEIMDREAARLP